MQPQVRRATLILFWSWFPHFGHSILKLYHSNFESLKNDDYLPIPGTFEELIKQVSHVFTNPKRFTFLVARPDITDDDYKKIIERRKEKYKYKLNETLNIVHTENMGT